MNDESNESPRTWYRVAIPLPEYVLVGVNHDDMQYIMQLVYTLLASGMTANTVIDRILLNKDQ